MKKKVHVLPKLRQEVKVKVDIFTSDDIKIYYTEKSEDFTARYTIISFITQIGSYWPMIIYDLLVYCIKDPFCQGRALRELQKKQYLNIKG